MKLCSSAIRLSVLVLYVLLTLYAGASSAQEKKNLRVVLTGLAWNSELPFRVALARGFFKAQGLEVQPIFVRGGPVALAALSSGEVDFAEIGGAQAIMALSISFTAFLANVLGYVTLANLLGNGLLKSS